MYKRIIGMPVSSRLAVGRALTLAIEFAVTIYLMKLLGPEPFGLMAMVMAVLALAIVLQDGGASSSLVSDPEYSDRRVGAALLIGGSIGITLYVVCLAITPLIAWWYEDPRIADLWLVVSTLVLISGVSSVPFAVAQRQQRFDVITWIPLCAVIMTAMVVLTVAQMRQDIWLIVINVLVSVLLSTVFLWIMVRPKIAVPTIEDLRLVFSFSKGVMISGLLGAMQRHADDIIVGKMLGANAAGLYNFSYRMLQVPLREFGGIVDKLAYPRLSSSGQDKAPVAAGMGQIIFEITLLCTPVCLGILMYAPDLITGVFGEKWLAAVIPFQVFAILAIYQVPSARLGLVFLVMRQTGLMAKWALVSTPVILTSFVIGVQWGIAGLALSYAVASLLLGFWRVQWVARMLKAKTSFFWRNWSFAVVVGAMMALIPYGLDKLLLLLHVGYMTRMGCVLLLFGCLLSATYTFFIMKRRKVKPLW